MRKTAAGIVTRILVTASIIGAIAFVAPLTASAQTVVPDGNGWGRPALLAGNGWG